MQNFRLIGAMVSEFCFFKKEEEDEEEEWTICENYVCLYFIPPVIFLSNFLLVVTFSHVLHLDVLRRQIELKLNVQLKFPYVWL